MVAAAGLALAVKLAIDIHYIRRPELRPDDRSAIL
jgi:hypothetical protein